MKISSSMNPLVTRLGRAPTVHLCQEPWIQACDDVWLCLRTSGRGSHFADAVAGALDLPLLAVVREEPSLATDMFQGLPPGSSAKGALAAAVDTVLARWSAVPDQMPRECVTHQVGGQVTSERKCGPVLPFRRQ
jgi:hypothetical protein